MRVKVRFFIVEPLQNFENKLHNSHISGVKRCILYKKNIECPIARNVGWLFIYKVLWIYNLWLFKNLYACCLIVTSKQESLKAHLFFSLVLNSIKLLLYLTSHKTNSVRVIKRMLNNGVQLRWDALWIVTTSLFINFTSPGAKSKRAMILDTTNSRSI